MLKSVHGMMPRTRFRELLVISENDLEVSANILEKVPRVSARFCRRISVRFCRRFSGNCRRFLGNFENFGEFSGRWSGGCCVVTRRLSEVSRFFGGFNEGV